MIVYRICQTQFADDIGGFGAKLYGGRWNSPGVLALYTSVYRSLSALEMAVHLNPALLGKNYQLLEILAPGFIFTDLRKEMPINWNEYPMNRNTQKMGDTLLNNPNIAGFIVPSALLHEEYNVILNPTFGKFNQVKIKNKRDFFLDGRLQSGNK